MKLEKSERVKFGEKDGLYWVLDLYEPTPADRRAYPVSYPPGDDGPFYQWSDRRYCTEEAALASIDD